MLDHVFLDAVGTLGAALADSLLERNRQDDRLAMDLLLGDVVWETSVTLPGDSEPSQVRADLTLEWPTWSQSAWRSWVLGETLEDPPEIGLEVVFRLQGLAARPATNVVIDAVGDREPPGLEHFEQAAIVAEEDLGTGEVAIDVAYEGTYRLSDPGDAPRRGFFAGDQLPDLGPASTDRVGPERYGPDGFIAGEQGARGEKSQNGPRAEEAPGAAGLPLTSSGSLGRSSLSPAMAANLVGLGRWVASTLVRLADLNLATLPTTDDE
jgi:hypothetical protein